MWIKTLGRHYSKFAWQGGYGIFSVSASQVHRVKDYIINQKEHHRKKSFENEYLDFLHAYGIDYDDNYVLKD